MTAAPKTQWPARTGWTLLLAVFALAIMTLGFAGVWTWGLFGMFSFQPRFADTVAILAAGQAAHAGADVYRIPNPFDPLGRPHVYGPGWLVTGAMGLTIHDAVWIGALLAFGFVIVMAALMAPRRPVDTLLALALLCSPPVLLGVSRGNNDLVVVLFVATAAWMLNASNRGAVVLGHGLVALAAVLKLYPCAAIPALLLRRGSRRVVLWGALGAAAVSLLVLWLWRDDYRRIFSLVPSPSSAMAYGIQVVTLCWQALRPTRVAYVLGAIIGAGVGLALLVPRGRRIWNSVPATGVAAVAFAGGAWCWIFSFLVIRSFPYRLVLILLAARLWLEHSDRHKGDDTGKVQMLLWTLVAWADVPKRFWAEIASRDQQPDGRGWQGFTFVVGLEQSLIVLLTMALLVAAIGAVWTRWRILRDGEESLP